MAQSLEQFAKSLLASGLPFAGEFESFLQGRPAAAQPKDGEQCARMLVKEKKLTAYQAQEVYAGRGKKLVLGNYVLHDKLGQGGMGMVLKAEHKRMGRTVALKVMSAAGMANPDAVKRFQREVQAAAKLTHPNIVTAHDADEAAGQHFLVMEYVEGSDLSQLVKKNGPMSIEKALHCILQAAKGLEFAHTKGVVHRDIKPANLLLDADGTVKILDMGLARLEHSAEQGELTGTGQIMGTVDYMAPEQALSTKTADARADIYSLGITLWYLLTARVAYEGDTLMAKLMAHSSGPIPSLSAINSNVSAPLDAVFKKMVAKTPAERYQSMTEVLAALERCRSGLGDASPTINLPSEDSKLSEFLHGMGKSPSRGGPASSAASPAAVAAPPLPAGSTNAAFEQTIDTGNPQTDTDPQTQTNLIVPRASPAPPASGPASAAQPGPLPKPSHSDWRVWAYGSGGLGGVLLVVLLVILFTRGIDPGKPSVTPGGSSAAALPAASDPTNFALRFDGTSNYVSVDTLKLSDLPTGTIELFATPSQNDKQAPLFDSDLAYLAQLGTSYGSKRQWVAGARGQHKFPPEGEAAVGVPTHLAVVWNASQIDLYVNGKKSARTNNNADKPAAHQHILLAAMVRDAIRPPAEFFSGVLDEVRISNTVRYAGDFAPPSAGQRFVPDKNTLALYHFDEGAGDILRDSSGHKRDGNIVGAKWVSVDQGGSTVPADVPREPRAWLAFSGQDQYVAIPGVASKGQNPVTLELWVRPDVVQDAHLAYLPGDQPLLMQQLWAVWNIARFQDGKALIRKANEPPATKIWHHLAGVWDGGRLQLFVNGKPHTDQDPDWQGSQPGDAFYLGGEPPTVNGGWARFFTGDLGPVRVSSTVRYKAEFTPAFRWTPDGDTLALYHFDEGTGTVLKDSSGHNHHGKIVGAKWVKVGPPPRIGVASAPAAPAGSGLTFAAAEDRVTASLAPAKVERPLTVEAWLTLHRLDGHRAIAHLGSGDDVVRLWFANREFSFGYQTPTKSGWAGANHPQKANQTYHVAGTWDADSFRVYVDGRLTGNVPCDQPPTFAPDSNFTLGNFPIFGQDASPGQPAMTIHSVRISKARYTGGAETPFTPPARFTADSDTLALYEFNEGSGDELKDTSGHNHHGKIVGAKWIAIGKTAPAPSASPFALEFDGKSSLVRIPWQYDGTHPLTLEVWATFARAPEDPACEILFGDFANAGTGLGNSRAHPRSERRSGKWAYWVKSGSEFDSVEETAPLPRGRPIHVAGVFDGSEQIRFYVDGKLQQRVRVSGAYMPSPQSFVLGGNAHGDGQPYFCFQGKLHGARITRAARYDGDFQPQQTFSSDPETAVLYHFDEGAGDVLKDTSGHNHHGKIVGAKWVRTGEAPQSLAEECALEFDGKTSHVLLPGLRVPDAPFTAEAIVTPRVADAIMTVIMSKDHAEGSLFCMSSFWAVRRHGKNCISPEGTVVAGKRVHLACAWDGTQCTLFVDGKPQQNFSEQPRYAKQFAEIVLGGNMMLDRPSEAFFDGLFHQVRFSKVSRYRAAFAAPARMTADADTLALYRFDEGQGDVLKDSSGHNRHGKIVGAKWVRASAIPGIPKNLPGGPAF